MSEAAVFGRSVEPWLQPIAGEGAPCGPDLEYDEGFLDMLRAAQGKPAAQFVAGEPPDWALVRQRAESLLDRSRDLRLAAFWTRAAVNLDGFSALLPGLALVRGLMENFWDGLHPLPDGDDQYARANVLAMLAHPDGLRGDLSRCVLCTARGVGELRLRSIAVAYGQLPARADEPAGSREQVAQMLATAAAKSPGFVEMVEAALEATRALAATAVEKFGATAAPDLGPLLDLVQLAHGALPKAASTARAAPSAAPAASSGSSEPGGRGEAGLAAPQGIEVRSREDAMRAIDLVCEFLDRTEPSSPAQMLLRRARRMINQDFLQLIKELAPEALPEASRILGVDPDSVTVR